MKTHRIISSVTASLLAVAMFAGCAGQPAANGGNGQEPVTPSTKQEPVVKKHEPVELKAYFSGNDEDFNKLYKTPIETKYSYITLTKAPKVTDDTITAGEIPDLIQLDNVAKLPGHIKQGLQFDLTSLIKEHNFDLSRVEYTIVQSVRAFSGGKLYALPLKRSLYGLFYNKDIFDRFAMTYPNAKVPMNYDQIIDLAKKMTRTDGGVQYYGYKPRPASMMEQLSVTTVDANTGDVLWEKDPKIRMWAGKLKEMIEIPNLIPEDGAYAGSKFLTNSSSDLFIKDKTLAMLPIWGIHMNLMRTSGLNWDIAPHPVWKEFPNKGPIPQTDSIVTISAVSKHKNEAFDVLSYILSEEFQMNLSRSGNFSVLTSKSIQQAFAADLPELKDKNLQAYFAITPQEYAKNYDSLDKLYSYNSTGASLLTKDINTALRDAAENHRKKIEEFKKTN